MAVEININVKGGGGSGGGGGGGGTGGGGGGNSGGGDFARRARAANDHQRAIDKIARREQELYRARIAAAEKQSFQIRKIEEAEEARRAAREAKEAATAKSSLDKRIADAERRAFQIRKIEEAEEARRAAREAKALQTRINNAIKQQRELNAIQKREDAAEEAEKRHQYAFRVREGVKRQRQQDAKDELVKSQQQSETQAKAQRYATYAGAAIQGIQGVASGEAGAGKRAGGSIGSTAGSVAGEAAGVAAGEAIGGTVGAALGPIGAIAGAVIGKEVGEKIGERIDDPVLEYTKALKLAGQATRFAEEGMKKIAGNDGIGLFVQATTGAADALEQIPIMGKVLSEEFRLLGQVVGSVKNVLDAFAARGREIAGLSGPISAAVAKQDVSRLFIDLREAQRAEKSYERLIEAQTKLEQVVSAGLLPIKTVIVEKLAVMIEAGIAYFINSLEATDRATLGLTGIHDVLRDIRRAMEPPPSDFMEMWLRGADGGGAPAAPALPLAFGAPPIIARGLP